MTQFYFEEALEGFTVTTDPPSHEGLISAADLADFFYSLGLDGFGDVASARDKKSSEYPKFLENGELAQSAEHEYRILGKAKAEEKEPEQEEPAAAPEEYVKISRGKR